MSGSGKKRYKNSNGTTGEPPHVPEGCTAIPLSHGHWAFVLHKRVPLVSEYRWNFSNAGRGYARCTRNDKVILMHRLIMGAGPEDYVDHINADGRVDGLNNADWNLRLCSQSENLCNRGATRASKSGYKGVYWITEKGRWRVEIKFKGSTTNLGYFNCKHEAAMAYNAAALRLHGSFARLNVIVEDQAKAAE